MNEKVQTLQKRVQDAKIVLNNFKATENSIRAELALACENSRKMEEILTKAEGEWLAEAREVQS